MKKRILFIFLSVISLALRAQVPPIGEWRSHLPWNSAIKLTYTGEKLWWASPYSIASIDPANNEIERLTRVNGLSETGVSAIGWNETEQALVVVWQNSRVNIVRENEISSIEDLANSISPGDKTVNAVYCLDDKAYLLTNSAIVVLDLSREVVSATFIIGSNGSRIPVTGFTSDAQRFYAATPEGLKSALRNAPNLSDYRSWTNLSGANGLSTGAVSAVSNLGNTIILLKSDSLFQLNGNQWNHLYTSGWTIRSLDVSGNKLLLSEQLNNRGRLVSLSATGTIELTLEDARYTSSPNQAIWVGQDLWFADTKSGLVKRSNNVFYPIANEGPPNSTASVMTIDKGRLFAGFGAIDINGQAGLNKDGPASFYADKWEIIPGNSFDSLPDIITLSTDPSTGVLWGGSYGGGLFTYNLNDQVQVFKQNSPIQSALGQPSQYKVSGTAFDAAGQLWVANYGANPSLHVRKTDGRWRSFSVPYPISNFAVSGIVIDDLDQKWIIAPNGQGLLCFNSGASVDNVGDDRWRWYRSGTGNGNLPSDQVLSILKDKNSFIWVGTTRGIGIIQCPQEVFTNSGCEALLPVVQQDNFAGYLFRDEQVQAMALDGADRKWIGTRNGVWLISADGEKTIYRFNTGNSPLPSNDIKAIAVDGQSGEVYFSTSKGIVSFRSTATEGGSTNESVLVYPNPVAPGYTGTIAIRGLVNNATVKITEPDGRLVFETRALGGQAIWNGKNYRGQQIRSGVYLVMISDETKKQKAVARIVFIAK